MANISILAKSFCKSERLRSRALESLNTDEVRFYEGEGIASGNDLQDLLDGADGIIVGREILDQKTIDEIVSEMRMVAEGVKTTAAVLELAARHEVEMPIAAEVGLLTRNVVVQVFGRPPHL